MRTLATIMFALLPATATPSKAPAKSIVAGHTLKLSFFNSIYADCRSRGESTLRIIHAPQHGHVNVKKIMDFPSSTSLCYGRLVPGTALYYQSRPEFSGKDHLRVEVVFPSGNSRRESYLVNVLPSK
jgi:hypothetical protein